MVRHAHYFVALKPAPSRRPLPAGVGLTLSFATSCAFWALVAAFAWRAL